MNKSEVIMSPRRKKLLRLTVIAALGIIAFGVWSCLVWAPSHRISKRNAERIRKGLTLGEINQLFGVGPGDYRSAWNRQKLEKRSSVLKDGPVVPFEDDAKTDGWTFLNWISDECGGCVFFNRDGEVAFAWIETWSETVAEKMKRWSGIEK